MILFLLAPYTPAEITECCLLAEWGGWWKKPSSILSCHFTKLSIYTCCCTLHHSSHTHITQIKTQISLFFLCVGLCFFPLSVFLIVSEIITFCKIKNDLYKMQSQCLVKTVPTSHTKLCRLCSLIESLAVFAQQSARLH